MQVRASYITAKHRRIKIWNFFVQNISLFFLYFLDNQFSIAIKFQTMVNRVRQVFLNVSGGDFLTETVGWGTPYKISSNGCE